MPVSNVSMRTYADATVVRIQDEPNGDPINWGINKVDADTGGITQGDGRLDNVLFKMEYFENLNGNTSGTHCACPDGSIPWESESG